MTASSTTFGGRYSIIEKVGSGGMADVYRARDELLGRQVALKVLSQRFSSDASFVQRFRREAQSAANLNHPNVVSLYDFGSDDGVHFIVMELIEGRSLAEVIHAEGPLLPERAAEIAADVAAALERAHDAGLVHRDVKPSNIMITNSGQTKVTDFGIVRAAAGADGEQTMTQTGMVIGTASYLSPEQAQGAPVDARSDVYSLGCVLYESLTGRAPFTGDTPLSIAYKHVRESAPPPSAANPDVPEALDAITLKCLAKNPENRYASAASLRDDLNRFLHGEAVRATPILADTTMVAPRTEGTQVLEQADYYEEPRDRRAGWYVLAALGILALFGVIAWLLAGNLLGGGGDVEVPELVGVDVERAKAELEELGLQSRIVRAPSEAPVGEVTDQDPAAGETVDEGTLVILTVSKGPGLVAVPEVIGRNVKEARRMLRAANLVVGQVTRVESDEVEAGEVIDQSPPAGEKVETGSTVTLVVSSGVGTTVVPEVIGLTREEAIAELTAADLGFEVLTAPDDAEEDTVIAQDPEAGTEVEENSVVTITVSEGQETVMPDVRGMDADEAEALLVEEYGLRVTRVEGACAQTPGTVCDQDPPPDTPIEEGDSATLEVQPGDASTGTGPLDFLALVLGFLYLA